MRTLELFAGRGRVAPGLWAALALAVAVAGSPQSAAAAPDAVVLKVKDAELHTPRGAHALALRIRVAAAKVCGGDDPIVRTGFGFARCRVATARRTAEQAHSALLMAALGLPPRELAGAER